MRTLLRSTLFATLTTAALLGGCAKDGAKDAPSAGAAKPAAPTLATATVDDVDHLIADGKCQAVDANSPATRKRLGTVPGAVLLSDYETFQASELPADKTKALVFYCANEQCGASHEAAARALTAGYTNVKVMPAGILGWVKAGKKVAAI
jgi:rhodanese-related sulfurtransferase